MASNYASPVSGNGGTPGSYPVFAMPVPIIVARGFQIFISLLIIVMSGLLMHGLVRSPYAFSFVCGFFTIVIAVYALVTEKATGARAAYNYWAVLSLDLVMVIFWLASMGANAAFRGTFKYKTEAECSDDGSLFDSTTCYTKRGRGAVAGQVPLDEMSAIAGLSALQMLIFAATFGYLAHQVRLHRQAQRQGIHSDDAGVVEMKGQYPVSVQAYDPHGPAPSYPGQPMPYDSTAYASASSGSYSAGAYGGQPTNVYDPHAQAQSAAYAAAVHPAATPTPEYQAQQQYSTAAPAQSTPEPYYSTSQSQQQPYYPPQPPQ